MIGQLLILLMTLLGIPTEAVDVPAPVPVVEPTASAAHVTSYKHTYLILSAGEYESGLRAVEAGIANLDGAQFDVASEHATRGAMFTERAALLLQTDCVAE